MDLKNFIAESLSQIVNGVVEAQRRCSEIGGRVNPIGMTYRKSDSETLLYDHSTGQFAEYVEFDVAVTVAGSTTAGGGGGISVFGANVGSKAEHSQTNETVSRIRFRTLVMFPANEKLPPPKQRMGLDEMRASAKRSR
jgi:hypothetical protein